MCTSKGVITVWAGLLLLLFFPAVSLPAQTGSGDNIDSVTASSSNDDSVTWHNKWLYVGLSAFWTPRMYSNMKYSTLYVPFGVGLAAELHVADTLAFATGCEIAPEWIAVSSSSQGHYRNIVLEVPFAVKLLMKPFSSIVVEPYSGVYLNLPLYDTTAPAPVAWMAGLQSGVKAGTGIFFIDSRFSMDFGMSSLPLPETSDGFEYQRYVIHIGIGYKFGLFSKNRAQ